MNFFKYQGTGNDFLLMEDQKERLSPDQIQKLCHRRYGVGADGVVYYQKGAPTLITIFNADGSHAPMCGNALRCVVQHLIDEGDTQTKWTLQVGSQTYHAFYQQNQISVEMGVPQLLSPKQALENVSFYHIDSGTRHLVIFGEQLEEATFLKKARWLRKHPRFSPLGVNVNFATLISPSYFHVRTYEKGVEAETFSCGTGGAAVCMAAWKEYGLTGSIEVEFHSKERLRYDLLIDGHSLQGMNMKGKAKRVFAGTWEICHL